MLADLGADVIKVEPPAGDSTRQMPGAVGTDSPSFNAVNRGKRSLVLNLKTAEGRDAFARLARSTDIVIENYRPGVMASLGLDYPALSAINPRLIYASISGYGQTGPDRGEGRLRSDRAGRLRHHVDHRRAGRPAGEGRRCRSPISAPACSRWSASSPRSQHRHRTGRGQHIDTSLVDAGVALSVWEATEYFAGARRAAALGSAHRMNAPYQAIRCADGYITLGARHRSAVPAALRRARPSRVGGVEPSSPTTRAACATVDALARADRGRHRRAAAPALARSCSKRTTFRAGRSTTTRRCSPTRRSPRARWSPTTDHPALGRLRTLGSPIKMSETPADATRRAPLLGEHTEEVLAEFGFSEDEIAALIADGTP